MAITPNTNLYLLKCPLALDNKNQITFESWQDQYSYFSTLEHLEVEDISYQRKDSVIRYPEHIDNLLEYTYCMYQNENYAGKWFYAFITTMEYVNDHCTKIYIKTDAFQTWMFSLVYHECFVEREIIEQAYDEAGDHLIPENLEIGEPICCGIYDLSDDLNPYYIVAYSGDYIDTAQTIKVNQYGHSYNRRLFKRRVHFMRNLRCFNASN